MDYKVRFTRYSSETCRRLISGPVFLRADNFREAVTNAGHMLSGMQSVASGEMIEIASIEATGYHGVQCVDMADIWQEPTKDAA